MFLRRVALASLIITSLGLLHCTVTSEGDPPVVGAPCTPSLENSSTFPGFRVTEDTIELGAPECGSGVCLVNHFQGRVSCPLGQPAPTGEQGISGCQDPAASPSQNAGKACCAPGTDTPLTEPVCGQCKGTIAEPTTRDAENAVYCTCRCGVADGEPDEPDFDFCECPDGFECSQIRPDVGLGDPAATGKFCIRRNTAYDPDQDQCGFVDGYWSSGGDGVGCAGVPTNKCLTPDGPCDD